MNNKRTLYIGIGVVLVICILAAALHGHSSSKTSKVHDAISQQSKSLSDESFTITSLTQPTPGWYLAKVLPQNGDKDIPFVILKAGANGSYKVIVGPGTSFPLSSLRNAHVPAVVANKILAFDDAPSNLPYTDPSNQFMISYDKGTLATQTFYVVVANSQYNAAALTWMQSNGLDPTASTTTLKYVTDPTIGKLPYEGVDFSLSENGYQQVSGNQYRPMFTATVYVPAAFANDPSASASYKQEVLQYLQSLGADPSQYVISYTVQQG